MTFPRSYREPAATALRTTGLSVLYDHRPALININLNIPSGHLVGIMGPNGSGKTTLIKSALGLVRPAQGSIEFFGQPLNKVKKRVAYVPQRHSVDWDFPITAKELVLMGLYGRIGLMRWCKKADLQIACEHLEKVGLSSHADKQIGQLSGGQQQRAFIARALVQNADIYLMDEPFSGIDSASEGTITHLLEELKDAGRTVVIVHHNVEAVRKKFDWVVLLNKRLIATGPIKEVLNEFYLKETFGA